MDLKNLLSELDLLGCQDRRRIRHPRPDRPHCAAARQPAARPSADRSTPRYSSAGLRLIKSPAEIAYVEKAASLADDALDAALPLIRPGGDEADILAAMQGAVFAGGGDYPANEFIIGSAPGRAALPLQGRPAQARRERPADARMGRRLRPLPRGDDAHRRHRRADQPPSGALQRLPRDDPGDRDGAAARQHVRRPCSTPTPGSWTSAAWPGTA